MSYQTITSCRSCGSDDLFDVIDLGLQPLANALREPDDRSAESTFPLALICCRDCSLVQLTVTVDPVELFASYHYFSSFSTTMIDAMEQLAQRTIDARQLDDTSLVVEIASNDGYLLQHYTARGVPVLGIDPARNVAEVAIERGVPTEIDFFSEALAQRLRDEGRVADVIHANNVMAHVPEINDVVAGIATLLAPNGTAIIETPHLLPLVDRVEFDTIYHEHVFYYSLTALEQVMAGHGLAVVDVEELPIHGGSLRLFVEHAGGETGSRVRELQAREQAWGAVDPERYARFRRRVDDLREQTVERLAKLKESGATVAAYGAAAKGAVLLNHYGIDHATIDFVADRNEHKHGLLMPGVGIPVVGPEALVERQPDYVLLLTWNFADEIIRQQAVYLERGGRFLVPVPELQEIGT